MLNAQLLGMLRQRKVLIAAAVALVVILIWVVAVFDPQGHKLANVNNQISQAQTQQAVLEARLDRLKLYSKESAEFEALGQKLSAAVPPTTDIYDYITALSNAASSTGMKISSVAPATPVAADNVAAIPVAISADGTYSQTLAFIKALYALPRLTILTQVSISGGGQNSNRSTQLTDQFNVYILAQPSAAETSR